MKKLLPATALSFTLTASALAADLPSTKAPIIEPPPPLTWTGFYVGLNAGGTFDASGNSYVVDAPLFLNQRTDGSGRRGAATSAAAAAAGTGWLGTNNGGFIGGGQVGYNYQFGTGLGGFGSAWLVGVEADIQGVAGDSGRTNLSSAAAIPAAPVFTPGNVVIGVTQVSKALDYIGTVRGRIGFLFTPTLLLYGTGGLAYGGVNSSTSQFQVATDPFFGPFLTPAWATAGSFSDTLTGWTAGGGVEWMFAPNWSAKLEYLYYDLGSINYSNGVSASFINVGALVGQPNFVNGSWTSVRFEGHIVRAGVNYHFNWGAPAPVLAKY